MQAGAAVSSTSRCQSDPSAAPVQPVIVAGLVSSPQTGCHGGTSPAADRIPVSQPSAAGGIVGTVPRPLYCGRSVPCRSRTTSSRSGRNDHGTARMTARTASMLTLLAPLAGEAQAHFVWIGIGRFQPMAEVWFNEQPEPGDAGLAGSHSADAGLGAYSRRPAVAAAAGSLRKIRPSRHWWHVAAGLTAPQRRGRVPLWRVHARRRAAAADLLRQASGPRPDAMRNWAALAAPPSLDLDIEPRPPPSGMAFNVWWQSRPAAGSGSRDSTPATMSRRWPRQTPAAASQWNKPLARLAVRARIARNRSPWRARRVKAYDGALHYATLTMTGLKPRTAEQSASGRLRPPNRLPPSSMRRLLKLARDCPQPCGRIFPAFAPRLTVDLAGYHGPGRTDWLRRTGNHRIDRLSGRRRPQAGGRLPRFARAASTGRHRRR